MASPIRCGMVSWVPWLVHPYAENFTITNDDGQIICRCPTAKDYPHLGKGEQNRVNIDAETSAHLISAAPDLLSALLDLRDNGPSPAAWGRANAAILKAMGGGPAPFPEVSNAGRGV